METEIEKDVCGERNGCDINLHVKKKRKIEIYTSIKKKSINR
tara:strand:- start:159 stop:284 length:126 start_codon:yes stop_codon:yes gene_type:complete